MSDTYHLTDDKIILNTLKGKKEFSRYTQEGCILEFMIKNIFKDLTTKEITFSASKIYKERTSKDFSELTGRGVRKLKEHGYIKRVSKGVFKFTGEYSDSRVTPFPKELRDEIIKRDNYTCQLCGITEKQGGILTADHIKPQDENGQPTLENGMCLCTKCENIKSNYKVNDFGLKMYKKYLRVAKRENDLENVNFFEELIQIFEKYKLK